MNSRLEEAIQLREAGKLEQARVLLLDLVAAHPDNPTINYQCAWSHDALGLEREAVPFYERAIALGLRGEDLAGALLGLGSTYRCLGEYHKAIERLLRALAETSTDESIQRYKRAILFYSDKLDQTWT